MGGKDRTRRKAQLLWRILRGKEMSIEERKWDLCREEGLLGAEGNSLLSVRDQKGPRANPDKLGVGLQPYKLRDQK